MRVFNPKRSNLVKGMVFSTADGSDLIQLVYKDSRNIWNVSVLNGDKNEYIRHDYIFTDRSHGYRLIGFNPSDSYNEDDIMKWDNETDFDGD